MLLATGALAPAVIGATILYGLLGMVLLVFGFWLVDKLTPSVDIWGQIVEKQNSAVAIAVAGFVIAIGVIIASVVRG